MAIRNIIQMGDETLRKKSFPVVDFSEKTQQLVDDMCDTLKKACGAGLAAPQVGVLRRIFLIMDDEGTITEFINPEILKSSGSQSGDEACLSVKGKFGTVVRPKKVVVKAQNRNGDWFTVTIKDFYARAICHEYDHLDGILYVDKAEELFTEKGKE